MDRLPSPRSLLEHGHERLASLCGAMGFTRSLGVEAQALFQRMTTPWAEQVLGAHPTWASDVTDDHSPFEFSLAIERGSSELRMLVEAQPAEPTAVAQWQAGRALSEALHREHRASVARLRAVEDLFSIEVPDAKFGMWHGANLREGAPAEFKVYLNPQAKGKAKARAVAEAALKRLGLADAWSSLPFRDNGRDEIKYFSLDMSDAEDARVKIYAALWRATTADIESALSAAEHHVPGEATAFCRALAESDGPFSVMPVQVCFSFTRRGGRRPVGATVYFPVRAYVPNDTVAQRRILACMTAEDRPRYERAVATFARRSLDLGTGMQTYASYRQQGASRRVTVYLSPELYAPGPLRSEHLENRVSGVMLAPVAAEERASTGRSAAAGGSI